MNNHTPGPWMIADEDSPLIIGVDSSCYVAQVFTRTENGNLRDNYMADINLIASAPDLLQALKDLVEAANSGTIFASAINNATHAIAMATRGNK